MHTVGCDTPLYLFIITSLILNSLRISSFTPSSCACNFQHFTGCGEFPPRFSCNYLPTLALTSAGKRKHDTCGDVVLKSSILTTTKTSQLTFCFVNPGDASASETLPHKKTGLPKRIASSSKTLDSSPLSWRVEFCLKQQGSCPGKYINSALHVL